MVDSLARDGDHVHAVVDHVDDLAGVDAVQVVPLACNQARIMVGLL